MVSVVLPVGYSAALAILAIGTNWTEQTIITSLIDRTQAPVLVPLEWRPDGQQYEVLLQTAQVDRLDALAAEAELSRAVVIMSLVRTAFSTVTGMPFPEGVPKMEARAWFESHRPDHHSFRSLQ